MEKIEITVIAQTGECSEFTLSGKKQRISMVISPLKVQDDDGTIKITSGCNMWKSCQNPGCQFSLIARGPEKNGDRS